MDEIQRKLIRIDKELAGGKDFYGRLLTSSPLVFAALGLITRHTHTKRTSTAARRLAPVSHSMLRSGNFAFYCSKK
jgi:hypothetical protein